MSNLPGVPMSQLPGLSPEQMRAYRRDGIIKINLVDLIGSEAFTALQEAYLDAVANDFGFAEEPAWNNAESSIRRHVALRAQYPAFAAVACSPVLGRAAAQLMGAERVRLWMDHTLMKYPGTRSVGWHQDMPYFPIDRSRWVTFWIAIEDMDETMAPLQYLAGSHRLGVVGRQAHVNEPWGYDHLLSDDDRALVGDRVALPLRAGEAFIHDGLTLHGSETNRSDRVRRALGIIYMDADTLYNGMPRPETDGLGLVPFEPFDHPNFPIVG